ncbi:hypothetical protein CFBP5875_04700 [Agrobacterium pusense]|uniref:hypothetical protein n=1 Tax=Agrobacterium pusense TaxID=648995 RepID=UPI0010BEDB37|nr:hypothetical protein [Agrobacterium pusense]QCL83918.1 hypothetical protein CFBP5875_04700 [Agrobacterium pusense]
MPDEVATFLIRFQNEIWAACLGVLGGSVRVAVGIADRERMPTAQVFAILVTGGVLAGTSGTMFTKWLGMGPEATSFCSFIVGIMGMNIVKHAIAMDVGSFLNRSKAK